MSTLQYSALILCLALTSTSAKGNSTKDDRLIKHKVFEVAKKYAESISCDTFTEENNVVALIPWNKTNDDKDNREEAKYALIWGGDIECSGGNGTYYNIAVVRIHVGDSFAVDQKQSSPFVKFDIPVFSIIKIISNTLGSITLDAIDWGPKDAHCCATMEVNVRIRQDEYGNWSDIYKTKVSKQDQQKGKRR